MKVIILIVLSILFSIEIFSQEKKLNYDGDFRFRVEENFGGNAQLWSREVVRFRFRTSYQINSLFQVNVGLGTGSKANPKTNDITLGNFNDKLELNLFTANVGFAYKSIKIHGGKFDSPFVQTEMVWDSDIYPQGISFKYNSLPDRKLGSFVSALYFAIDDQPMLKDTYMSGLQVGMKYRSNENTNALFCASFYNYSIGAFKKNNILSAITADDIRTNFLRPDSTGYLNNFRLLDGILKINSSIGSVPVGVVLDFVYNIGAKKDNKGFSADFFAGKSLNPKDFKLLYGISFAETDAVMAAFSNDNTLQPTNYFQHSFAFDYVLLMNTSLNLTYYLYRKLETNDTTNPYLSRIRLNLSLRF